MKKRGKKNNNLLKWIFVGILIFTALFVTYKIFFTGQVVSGIGNLNSLSYNSTVNSSVTINLNSSNPNTVVTFSGKSYLVSLVYSQYTGIGTLTNISGTSVTIFRTTGAFITVNVSGTNVTRLVYLSNSTIVNGLNVVLINATYKVTAGQMGYIPFSSALIRVSEATCNSLTNTIIVGNAKMINGLNVSLIYANSLNNLISASLKAAGNILNLTGDVSSASAPSTKKIITVGTNDYLIELLSASQTYATIRVTSCSQISNLVPAINQTINQTSTTTQNCYSVAQRGCLNDRSKSCCSGLTCKNLAQGGTADGICLPISSSCTPKTCSQLGKSCGSVSNGCNSTLNCGACASGKTCTNGNCLGTYGSYCTSGTQCATGRCKPVFRFLWYTSGNYCY